MSVSKRLEDWKNEFNPLYKKEFTKSLSSQAENEDLFIITITGVLQIILFIVILMGFFDAGNALINSSKSKNSNN